MHRRVATRTRFDACFVGNLFPGERLRLVELIRRQVPNCHVGRHYFDEMAAHYSASRVVFNRSVSNDINMRVFEALGCGSLLLTNDLRSNGQAELFQDATHLATYASDEELMDKLRFYLRNKAARERIAAAGRAEVLARHTYRHRMARVLDAVSAGSVRAVAGPRTTDGFGDAGRYRVPGDRHDETAVARGPARDRRDAMTGPLTDPVYFEHDRPEVAALVPAGALRVLDVGCGAGRFGEAIKSRPGVRVTGVEMNPEAAELAGAGSTKSSSATSTRPPSTGRRGRSTASFAPTSSSTWPGRPNSSGRPGGGSRPTAP